MKMSSACRATTAMDAPGDEGKEEEDDAAKEDGSDGENAIYKSAPQLLLRWYTNRVRSTPQFVVVLVDQLACLRATY